jgi:hypothetical protein
VRSIEDVHFRAPRDFITALELRGRVWGKDHPYTSAAYFNWLYAHKPPTEPQGVLLRREDGVAIAFVGLVERSAAYNGKISRVGYGLDFMIRPGLAPLSTGRVAVKTALEWLKLVRTLGFDFEYHCPNSSSFELFTSKHVGERLFFMARLLARPLPNANPSERLHPRVPVWLGAAGLRAAGAAISAYTSLRVSRKGEVVAVETFDHEFDGLYERAAPALGFATVRSSEYLRWRYSENPINRYHSLTLRKGDRLEGILVSTDRVLMGARATLIVDLVVADWSGAAVLQLVEAAVRQAKSRNRDLMAALASPGSRLDHALQNVGFLAVPRRFMPRAFPTIGRAIAAESERMSDPRHWHFTWGDTDVV